MLTRNVERVAWALGMAAVAFFTPWLVILAGTVLSETGVPGWMGWVGAAVTLLIVVPRWRARC